MSTQISFTLYNADEVVPMPDFRDFSRSHEVLAFDGTDWIIARFRYSGGWIHSRIDSPQDLVGITHWCYLPETHNL